MEVTIDLETCKIVVYLDKLRRYAIFISKWNGEAITLTIPQLIAALKSAKAAQPPSE